MPGVVVGEQRELEFGGEWDLGRTQVPTNRVQSTDTGTEKCYVSVRIFLHYYCNYSQYEYI
jgi:hypothetical protein